jgi:hypothetical protein
MINLIQILYQGKATLLPPALFGGLKRELNAQARLHLGSVAHHDENDAGNTAGELGSQTIRCTVSKKTKSRDRRQQLQNSDATACK